MSDTENKSGKKLGLLGGNPSRPGQVRQSFSHGRSKSVVVETKDKKQVGFVQIAGLVARRIICDLEDGKDVRGGDRYGIIRFGSRMDIYLPKGTKPNVLEGQTMIGGETILAAVK